MACVAASAVEDVEASEEAEEVPAWTTAKVSVPRTIKCELVARLTESPSGAVLYSKLKVRILLSYEVSRYNSLVLCMI